MVVKSLTEPAIRHYEFFTSTKFISIICIRTNSPSLGFGVRSTLIQRSDGWESYNMRETRRRTKLRKLKINASSSLRNLAPDMVRIYIFYKSPLILRAADNDNSEITPLET